MVTPPCFWYNGQLINSQALELAIDDPGLVYGATVFTTLRVYQQSLDSRLTHWSGHCDRLRRSLDAFGWLHPDWSRLRQGAEQLSCFFPVLRLVVFPDGREWITGRSLPVDLADRQRLGITAWVATDALYHRSQAAHKTGNYLPPWLALQAAQRHGASEAILTNTSGDWLETSTGNLWGWQNQTWWTPPLAAGILPGCSRSQLMQWLATQGIPVQEVVWSADLVQGFEAIAYTNSVVEVVPIHTVLHPGATQVYAPNHPAFEQLLTYFSLPF